MGKVDIKDHIIETASKLFYENGYNATGINEIIAKAGIAKATLYHHFKGKEEICINYLQLKHEAFMNQLKAFISEKNDSKSKLIGIFDFLRAMYREDNFSGCWGIKLSNEIPKENVTILEVIQRQKKELLLYLGEIVNENLRNISRAEIEKISGGIYLLYESAIAESYLHRNDWPIFMAKRIAPSLFDENQLV